MKSKNIYEQETLAHKDEPIIKKHYKQIKLNRILWIVGSAVGLIVTILMVILSLKFKWDGRIMGIAIGIPAVVTALAIAMTIIIWIGNQVGVKMYKTDKITFYSGPWTNILYINDQLIYRGSSEHKMVGTLCDKSLCKINLKTTSFTINILPPGSDPVTGLAKQPENKVPETHQAKMEQPKEEIKK